MKVRNPLLFAYIVFLILCILFKNNIEEKVWEVLIGAITCSSTLFAVADCLELANNVCKRYRDICLEIDKSSADIVKLEEFLGNKREYENIAEQDNTYGEILDSLAKIKIIVSDVNKIALKNLKLKNFYINASSFFKMIAFLSFFSILVFKNIGNYIIGIQDILTINAFVIILMSQYNKIIFEDTADACLEDVKRTNMMLNEIMYNFKLR